jgi:hypothetical protein
MNRKARDKESLGKSGPERAGNPAETDPGRFLEYENIPDPISFEYARTGTSAAAANNNKQAGEQNTPKSRG